MKFQSILVCITAIAVSSFSQLSLANTTTSSVFITAINVNNGAETLSNNTGTTTSINNLSIESLADGGTVLRDASATANLVTGELKTYAYIKLDNTNDYKTEFNSSLVSANPFAVARANFGDTFSAYSGSSPFSWSSGDQASFNFNISGITTPSNSSTVPFIGTYTSLSLEVRQIGYATLEEQLRQANIAYFNNPTNENLAIQTSLNSQLSNMVVVDKWWTLGETNLGGNGVLFANDTLENVALNANGTANISFNFNPNSDFEWDLRLYSIVSLDGKGGNAEALMDFSHTVVTSYNAPVGTTTFSASGLFPNTVAAVPEPETYAMFLAGLGLLGFAKRRKQA